MELAGDAAEHLLFAQQRRRRSSAASRAEVCASVASNCSAACEARWVSVSVSNPLVTALNLCSSGVDRLGEQRAELVTSMCSNKITRIDTFWQGQNPKIDLIFFKQCQQRIQNFIRATATGVVAIEHERDAIGVAAQELQMALAERGAKHRDTVVDAMLMGHEHIGVAFHDDRAAFVFEVFAGDIEGV